MQITTRQFLLIERDQIAALNGDLGQPFAFVLRTIAPKNFVRLAHRRHVFDPFLDMGIGGYRSCYITHGVNFLPLQVLLQTLLKLSD